MLQYVSKWEGDKINSKRENFYNNFLTPFPLIACDYKNRKLIGTPFTKYKTIQGIFLPWKPGLFLIPCNHSLPFYLYNKSACELHAFFSVRQCSFVINYTLFWTFISTGKP